MPVCRASPSRLHRVTDELLLVAAGVPSSARPDRPRPYLASPPFDIPAAEVSNPRRPAPVPSHYLRLLEQGRPTNPGSSGFAATPGDRTEQQASASLCPHRIRLKDRGLPPACGRCGAESPGREATSTLHGLASCSGLDLLVRRPGLATDSSRRQSRVPWLHAVMQPTPQRPVHR